MCGVYEKPRILACGDAAVIVEFGDRISPELNAKVLALTSYLERNPVKGVEEVVPTYRSVLVRFDPLIVDPRVLESMIEQQVAKLEHTKVNKQPIWVIPVCYGGEFGPDLEFVSQHAGLSPEEVISIHSTPVYRVYMLGFTPGFPYLGGMDHRIAVPRLETPHTKIPAGSVGIALEQTGIYPIDSPGGWRLIGRTPLTLFDPFREKPFLLNAGDHLRFKAVSKDEYEQVREQIENGTYEVEMIPWEAVL
ncbi:5-oxoprolinase subunit PxpB [Coprothermobacteraceae bacterium]|nr:5-oxoprolinase subunit PxpB [Coprothermobacteraceae bacterium]